MCNPRCHVDGVCDQITKKCICPEYSNKYVKDDCANGNQFMSNFMHKCTVV